MGLLLPGCASVLFAAHERQEFVAGLFVVAELTEHSAGHGLTVLLFYTAHLHAKMPGFDDDADALRSDFFFDGLGNLAGHALLNLQAAGEHVDQARDLAETDDPLARQIRDVGFSEKRQQVVLAEAEEFDVLYQHHLVIADAERCSVEEVVYVLMIAAGQEFQRLFITLGCLTESFALGIFADKLDDLAHVAGDRACVDGLGVVKQDFFRWLGPRGFPSELTATPVGSVRLSAVYSKLLLVVSSTRTRSSLAGEKDFKRWNISTHKFSVVGTLSRKAGTSSLSERWSKASRISRSTKPSRSAKLAIIPVAGSTSPERLISTT